MGSVIRELVPSQRTIESTWFVLRQRTQVRRCCWLCLPLDPLHCASSSIFGPVQQMQRMPSDASSMSVCVSKQTVPSIEEAVCAVGKPRLSGGLR